MITYYDDVEQGSDEWFSMRCGVLTASEMKLIVTPTLKKADNDKTRQHLYELLAQRVNQYTEPHYIGSDMIRGHVDEVDACIVYEEKYAPVKECGFIINDKWGFKIGYSPDGLVSDDGLIECKSRRQKYQTQTIIENAVPDEFMLQLQTGLLVSERKWIDFVSYCGGMPMFVKRVFPDVEMQATIIDAAADFERKINLMGIKYMENSKEFFFTERKNYDDSILI